MVLAGLGGQSNHMVSAAVNALGRLTYDFSGMCVYPRQMGRRRKKSISFFSIIFVAIDVVINCVGVADLSPAMLDSLMETALVLLKSKRYLKHSTISPTTPIFSFNRLTLILPPSREVLKAILGFGKVALVAIKPPEMQRFLPVLIPGVLTLPGIEQSHFKMKVRVIFERLLRKFG